MCDLLRSYMYVCMYVLCCYHETIQLTLNTSLSLLQYLALPIMKSGGRLEMYKLMGLEPPVMLRKEKPKAAPLVFDRTGEQDKGRYGGLKMGLLGDDDMMGEALQQANQKVRTGERMRSKIVEEDYEQPFAGE